MVQRAVRRWTHDEDQLARVDAAPPDRETGDPPAIADALVPTPRAMRSERLVFPTVHPFQRR